MPSVFQTHVADWQHCQLCEYCHVRSKIVLFRGDVPCDVLFVGEAPGPSENKLGVPFIGPAGKLLDQMIRDIFPSEVSYGFTNLVACIPKDADSGDKFTEPSKDSIAACRPRLEEIVRIASPQVIVQVGKLAEKHFSESDILALDLPQQPKVFQMTHPAAVLRAKQIDKGMLSQGMLTTLGDVLEAVVPF